MTEVELITLFKRIRNPLDLVYLEGYQGDLTADELALRRQLFKQQIELDST